MFFQIKDKTDTPIDTYDKISYLVNAILQFECPEHRAQHHILYTANMKLETYREAQQFYRKVDNPAHAHGRLSRDAYQQANRNYNQLITIIRRYMHLSDDNNRDHFKNHYI